MKFFVIRLCYLLSKKWLLFKPRIYKFLKIEKYHYNHFDHIVIFMPNTTKIIYKLFSPSFKLPLSISFTSCFKAINNKVYKKFEHDVQVQQ